MWSRSGDLYEALRSKERFLRGSESVNFCNNANFGMLGSIVLRVLPVSLELKIELEPSPFSREKMQRLCKEKFLPSELQVISGYDNTIFIICSDSTPIKKLIELFKEINQQSPVEEFSKEVFQELEQIAELYSQNNQRKISDFHHYLPLFEGPDFLNAADDEGKGFNDVYHWVSKYAYQDQYPIQELARMQARRSDIKEWYWSLNQAIRFNRADVLILLMSYGANPFRRIGSKSIFEVAKSACEPCMVDAMITYVSRPQKPVASMDLTDFIKMFSSSNNRLCKISGFKNQIIDNTLYTYFDTNQGKVTLVLRETDDLSPVEMDQAFQMYEDFFEASSVCQTTAREFFNYDTKGPRKFFQGVILNGELVAVHFVEYIVLKDYPDNIYFHIDCVYAKDCIRGKGFTNPLIKLLGYVLQELFDDKNIIQVMQSISIGSLALVEGAMYFPKYVLPFFTKEMMEKLISHMQRNPDLSGQAVPLVRDEPTCYSKIESQIKVLKDAKEQPARQLPKEFFLDHFHRGMMHPTQKHHAALVATLLSDETWELDSEACNNMGLEPSTFIKDYARFFSRYVKELKPHDNQNKPVYLPVSKALLLQNQRIPSQAAIMPAKKY